MRLDYAFSRDKIKQSNRIDQPKRSQRVILLDSHLILVRMQLSARLEVFVVCLPVWTKKQRITISGRKEDLFSLVYRKGGHDSKKNGLLFCQRCEKLKPDMLY